MQTTGNTILITGGGSGIGLALAVKFHKLGNQVIIAGRRKDVLDAAANRYPGMKTAVLDVQDAEAIRKFAANIAQQYPTLNVLINNAGIMKQENLLDSSPELDVAEATINTNLLAPIRLTAALLPLLRKQPQATIMTVSSGLAFVPLALTPTYCATKAAIHSYSQSLRFQLASTNVRVVELIPPYVATELLSPHQAKDPNAMPLDDFISEVMDILKNQPDAQEICVKRVYPLRFASDQGQAKYEQFFDTFNRSVATTPQQH